MTFETMGLHPTLLANLKKEGITEPTPIQFRAIPAALQGRDVVGLAQTGTGKTAAFGLLIAHDLLGSDDIPAPKTVRTLILAPTRELASQIQENLAAYLRGTRLRIGVVVGGASINAQTNRLQRSTDILVATPGRLLDLIERKAVRLDQTRYLMLDEADQMLDLGFIHALRKIARLLPTERQMLLFSATMPKQMAEIAGAHLTDPIRVEVSPPGKPADRIDQACAPCRPGGQGAASGRIAGYPPRRVGACLHPHQARRRPSGPRAGKAGLRRRGDPRQQESGTTHAGAEGLSRGGTSDPRGD